MTSSTGSPHPVGNHSIETCAVIRTDAWESIRKILNGFAWITMLSAGIGLVFLVVSFGWMVYGRYVLNDTPTWIGQFATVLIIYIVCFGAAVGVYRNTHLSIEFVRDLLPTRLREVMHLLSDLLMLFFGGIMAWQGWLLTLESASQRIPLIKISAAWRSAPLIFCGALIVVFVIFRFVDRTVMHREGKA